MTYFVKLTSSTTYEEIRGWNHNQVPDLLRDQLMLRINGGPTVFSLLTPSQVVWLSLEQIRLVGIANVPQDQVRHLSTDVIASLTATELTSATANSAGNVSGAGAPLLSLLQPNQAFFISSAAIRDFSLANFRSAIADTNGVSGAGPKLLSCLSDANVGFINDSVLQNMEAADFTTYIGLNQGGTMIAGGGGALITRLGAPKIGLLRAEQFTPEVLRLMSRAQIQAINPDIISQFSATQLKTICASGDPVSTQLSVTNGQFGNVTARQLNETGAAYWTPEQILIAFASGVGASLTIGFLAGYAYNNAITLAIAEILAESLLELRQAQLAAEWADAVVIAAERDGSLLWMLQAEARRIIARERIRQAQIAVEVAREVYAEAVAGANLVEVLPMALAVGGCRLSSSSSSNSSSNSSSKFIVFRGGSHTKHRVWSQFD